VAEKKDLRIRKHELKKTYKGTQDGLEDPG